MAPQKLETLALDSFLSYYFSKISLFNANYRTDISENKHASVGGVFT